MIDLKQLILKKSNFELSDVYPEEDGLLTRELVTNNTFSFLDHDDIIIVISELEDKSLFFTLDFGSFEDDEDSLDNIVMQNKNLIQELIKFIKQESGIDFSIYTFDKPEITIPEEGIIEISFK